MQKTDNRFVWYSILALFIYCIVFIWFTQPLLSFFGSGYIGLKENGDAHQYYWNIFNFKHQIGQFKNPFYSNYIFAPEGTSLVMHTYTPIMGLFALPFNNNILALNIFIFINFILSAYGAYLLCNKLISNPLLSIAAGIVYAFCPYKLLHLLEHYHLILTAAVPFFILCFLEAFAFTKGYFFPKITSRKHFYYCLVLGLVLLLSDYYATFSILYFCLFYALYFKVFATINYRSLKLWLIAFTVIIVSHIVLHQFKVFGIDNKGGLWWSGDLLGYIIPPFNSQYLYSSCFAKIENTIYHYPGSVEYCMFLGYSVLILLVVLFIWLFKHPLPPILKPFGFITLVFFLMTIPDLKFGGKSLLNLPVSFFHYIPFFNNIRSPTRMLPIVGLVLMPVSLYALSSLINSRRKLNLVLSFGLLFLLAFEYKPVHNPIIKVREVPEIISKLHDMPQGILLHIPFGVRDGFIEQGKFETKKLWYQTIHRKPLIDGYISRLSDKTKKRFDSIIFSEMDSMQKTKEYIADNAKFKLPVRYILVEPNYSVNFEPFFDKNPMTKKALKTEIAGFILYKLY